MTARVIAPPDAAFSPRPGAAVVGRCQRLVGQFGEVSWSALLIEMNAVVAELPATLTRREQIIVTSILDHLLARFVRGAGIDGRADVANRFLGLADAAPNFDAWRSRFLSLMERCAALVEEDVKRQVDHTRAMRMLQIIEARYVDPKLKMSAVAQAIDVSPSHAARILKQQTGFGFSSHLHRRRVAAARRLLVEAPLSIKEISAAVGYAHPSQLSRHFKLACGETPAAFRAARLSTRRSA